MKNAKVASADDLRRRAEECLQGRQQRPQSEADTQRLMHELQVHQIELEMQNEELQQARKGLETELERQSELYNLAPAACLVLQPDGTIQQANLAAASRLGTGPTQLLNQPFALFLATEARATFEAFLTRVLKSKAPEICEATLAIEGKAPQGVQVRARASEDGQECRVVLTDITEYKRAEGLRESETFTASILNSLTAHIAVLDMHGVIIAVNAAWRRFARENGGADSAAYLGANYLTVCEESLRGEEDETVHGALQGLRAVLCGRRDQFSLDTPVTRRTRNGGSISKPHVSPGKAPSAWWWPMKISPRGAWRRKPCSGAGQNWRRFTRTRPP